MSDDWFRNKVWDEETSSLFNKKIKRSRQGWSRWQYFKIQAGMLAYNGYSEEALELYERSLTEVKDVEDDWKYQTYAGIASVYLMKKDFQNAEKYFKKASETCPRDERRTIQSSSPEKSIAKLIFRNFPSERHEEAYRWKSFDEEKGSSHAWRYEALCEVEILDPLEKPYEHPESAAEGIVVYHHADGDLNEEEIKELFEGNKKALSALDNFFVKSPPKDEYNADFLKTYLFEFGAYLGRVLVNSGGRWVVKRPLYENRVVINGKTINPFMAAHEAIFWNLPLTLIFDEAVNGTSVERPWII